MKSVRLIAASLVTLSMLAAAPLADAQERYRWRDDNGSLRISDRIPPDAAGRRIEVLNARGMVIRVIEPAKTPEELTAEAEQKALADQQAKAAADQARRDRMLLDSYTAVDEIERRRDNRLAQLETYINVSTDSLSNLESTLAELEEQAKRLTDSGKDVPAALAKRIAATKDEIKLNREFLDARKAEQAQIKEQFDADIERFKELHGSGRR